MLITTGSCPCSPLATEAGSLVREGTIVPAMAGARPTDRPLFVGLLGSVVVII